jgi:26S proteasome regulatory subunit N2
MTIYRSEALYEADDLPKDARQLAALIVSKVYYYLEEYNEALSFALSAGPAFETEARTAGAEEYVETVVCRLMCMTSLSCLLTLF